MAELTKEQLATLKALMPVITEYNQLKNVPLAGLKFLAVISKADSYKTSLGLHLSPTTGDIQGNELKPSNLKPSRKPTKQSNKDSDKKDSDKKEDDKQSSHETNNETDKDKNKQNDVSNEQVSSIHNHINSISDENQLKLIRQKIVGELHNKEKK